MSEALPTCCEFHGFEEGGCNGRHCPEGRIDLSAILTRRLSPEEMTRRQQEADLRWQCARSGQMDSRQIAAHIAAGELPFPIGYESADPAHREPVRVAREPLPVSFAGREPFDWQALVLWIGVGVAFGAIAALSIADPRDLSTLWPRVLAALSF